MDSRSMARRLREKNPGMKIPESLAKAEQMLLRLQGVPRELRQAEFFEPQVPDYNVKSVGEVLADAVHQVREGGENPFGRGPRDKGEARPKHGPPKCGEVRPERRLSPTHWERMNRSLVELSHPAFKIHTLLWMWTGASAKGNLPFFTLKSLARFCQADRNVIRRAMGELVSKGWIQPGQYDCHKKNSLYKLVPIAEVPKPSH